VYVATDNGYVYALSVADGSLAWSFNTDEGPTLNAYPIYRRRRYKSDELALGESALLQPTLFVNSYQGNVFALDATTGQSRWNFPTTAIGAGAFQASVFAVHNAEKVTQVSRLTYPLFMNSSLIVESPPSAGVSSVLNGGVLLFGVSTYNLYYINNCYYRSYYYDIYALEAATGTEIWTKRFEKNKLGRRRRRNVPLDQNLLSGAEYLSGGLAVSGSKVVYPTTRSIPSVEATGYSQNTYYYFYYEESHLIQWFDVTCGSATPFRRRS
jgi:outer membrane protein assembly factor BamB